MASGEGLKAKPNYFDSAPQLRMGSDASGRAVVVWNHDQGARSWATGSAFDPVTGMESVTELIESEHGETRVCCDGRATPVSARWQTGSSSMTPSRRVAKRLAAFWAASSNDQTHVCAAGGWRFGDPALYKNPRAR